MRTPIDETNAGDETSRNEQRSKGNAVESRRDFLKSAVAAAVVVGARLTGMGGRDKGGNALSRPGADGSEGLGHRPGRVSHRQKRDG